MSGLLRFNAFEDSYTVFTRWPEGLLVRVNHLSMAGDDDAKKVEKQAI